MKRTLQKNQVTSVINYVSIFLCIHLKINNACQLLIHVSAQCMHAYTSILSIVLVVGIGMEGIGCLLAGAWGSGNGMTSYSENIGAIGITRVISCGVCL